MAHHRLINTAILLILLLLVSCASGPQTGVRSDFEQTRVTSVAIAPFYSSGSFGIDGEQHRQLQADYEEAAAGALALHGFDVVDSQAMRHHLTELELWREFEEGIPLRQSLRSYFEPIAPRASGSIEVQTLRELASQGALPTETILFGEVIYHSPGTCSESADVHAPYAEITVNASAPSELPRPCVSSHFQAKLVDVATGRTMWFNRAFLETHTSQVDAATERQNIIRAIALTLNADASIAELAPLTGDDGTHAGRPAP